MDRRQKKIDYIYDINRVAIIMEAYQLLTDDDILEITDRLQQIKILLELDYNEEPSDFTIDLCTEITQENLHILRMANLRNSISLN